MAGGERVRRAPPVEDLVSGVLAGNRAALGRAITLVESRNRAHRPDAQALLRALLPHSGRSQRIGISGVPGVGKSTFIETFGTLLIERGHRVAVLAVDPSSRVSGGSILGDKTRMTRLSRDARAFVRPSPSGGSLGGVAQRTRESLLVCEAAGFDVILVETVGVGQSEVAVSGMVDFFLVLMLAGAGDELQGIKRGILELVDLLAIHKADGANLPMAQSARAAYERALRLMRPSDGGWRPEVLTCSSTEGEGHDAIWCAIERHREHAQATGRWEAVRREQVVRWMHELVEEEVLASLYRNPTLLPAIERVEEAVRARTIPASQAADELLRSWKTTLRGGE